VDRKASLENAEKKKILDSTETQTPTPLSSSPLPVAIPTTLSPATKRKVRAYEKIGEPFPALTYPKIKTKTSIYYNHICKENKKKIPSPPMHFSEAP
jgi:hypothetical protein